MKPRTTVLLLVACIAALAAGELLVRAYVRFGGLPAENRLLLFADDTRRYGLPRYSSHPYTVYMPTPGYAREGTRHNHLGFRGPEPAQMTEAPLRVVALGESSTYGTTIADDSLTYPAQLEALLTSRGGSAAEVINAGVGGYTTFESLATLMFRVLPLRPDIVVIYHGANDLHARRARPFRPDNTGYRRAWSLREGRAASVLRGSYLARLVAVASGRLRPLGVEHYTRNEWALEQQPTPTLLIEHPPTHFRRNVVTMIQLARASKAEVVLATFASNSGFGDHYAGTRYYIEGFAEMNHVIRQVARAEGVVLADVDSLVPRTPDLWDDGVHLNALGARVQAEIIADAIVRAGLLHGGARRTANPSGRRSPEAVNP